MDMEEIRNLVVEELDSAIDDQREELFKLRFQIAIGQVTDTSRLKKTRRTLSRLLTVRREREIVAYYHAGAEAQE